MRSECGGLTTPPRSNEGYRSGTTIVVPDAGDTALMTRLLAAGGLGVVGEVPQPNARRPRPKRIGCLMPYRLARVVPGGRSLFGPVLDSRGSSPLEQSFGPWTAKGAD